MKVIGFIVRILQNYFIGNFCVFGERKISYPYSPPCKWYNFRYIKPQLDVIFFHILNKEFGDPVEFVCSLIGFKSTEIYESDGYVSQAYFLPIINSAHPTSYTKGPKKEKKKDQK